MKHLLSSLKFPLLLAAAISTGVNMLMLVSPIFMMQVFDRVLMSGHLETLYGLTLIAVFALMILGAFEALRQQVLSRAGDWLERAAGDILIDTTLEQGTSAGQAFQNVKAVRRFFCAQGVFALLDAPWLFVFAALLWWMHPWLGITALVGAAALLAIALATEMISRRPLTEAQKYQSETQSILSSALRNADAVKAMGMAAALKDRWNTASSSAYDRQSTAAERSALLSGMAKAVRLIVQTAILALGAMLVLTGDISSGGMIAASILLGRCLAPVEQSIGAWKGFVLAREAWHELVNTKGTDEVPKSMNLPAPVGKIDISNLSYQPDPARAAILQDIDLTITPGEVLCLIGPSGSGKTTLSRLLVGALRPTSGEVRLDERSVQGWNPAQLGQYVGYLPQGVELLPGTLKENIQRFGKDDPEGVIAAAKLAQVDTMIRNLPDGYETEISPNGTVALSAGQLQRVALARALYGAPQLIVLDEPNANLDVEGEHALFKAVKEAAASGATVIVISHRPALLEAADRIAVLQAGKLMGVGPRSEMLRPRSVEKRSNPATVETPEKSPKAEPTVRAVAANEKG